jgi:hypothetical protein
MEGVYYGLGWLPACGVTVNMASLPILLDMPFLKFTRGLVIMDRPGGLSYIGCPIYARVGDYGQAGRHVLR